MILHQETEFQIKNRLSRGVRLGVRVYEIGIQVSRRPHLVCVRGFCDCVPEAVIELLFITVSARVQFHNYRRHGAYFTEKRLN